MSLSQHIHRSVITSPTGAVAKYCDEYVCVCVCLSARISLKPYAPSLPNFLCTLPVPWLSAPMAC